MDSEDFEGTLVLDSLAQHGLDREFFDAVDADDFQQARRLMEQAGVDPESIEQVLQKMREADGD